MLHEGFTNSFRFIDYSKAWKWEPPKDYNIQFIHSDHLERREILHGNLAFKVFFYLLDSEEESDKNHPSLTIPLRSIFEEKVFHFLKTQLNVDVANKKTNKELLTECSRRFY